MPGQVQKLWQDASAPKRLLLLVLPVVLIALAATGITFAATSGGGGANDAQANVEPTEAPPTPTEAPPTPSVEQVLRYFAAIMPTATPEPAPAASGGSAPRSSGGGGSAAPPAQSYVPQPALTGPGPIVGTDISLSIPKIGVNTGVHSRTVGSNGKMGDPVGAWQVIWYDFSSWGAGYGGYPGVPGANAVFAGHVDYIRVGPAIFYSIRNLAPGDQVTVTSAHGTFTYAVQWGVWAGPNDDFTQYVTSAGVDAVTLVTCIGTFSAGHYSNRYIVRATRI